MRAAAVFLAGIALLAASAAPQDLAPKAAPQDRPIALVNATIHPVSGEVVENGYLLFEAGIILDIGNGPHEFKESVLVVDVEGKHVWPGLVGAPVPGS